MMKAIVSKASWILRPIVRRRFSCATVNINDEFDESENSPSRKRGLEEIVDEPLIKRVKDSEQ